MENVWNSQELTIVLVLLPGNNRETVPLLFFFPGQKMRSCLCFQAVSSGGNYWICCIFFYISFPKCRLCLFVSSSFSKSPLPHNWPLCSESALSQRETVLFSSKLWSGRNWGADPGGGAGSRGSPLLPPRFHPPRRLPPWRSLAAHHRLLLPEEQLGGSAAEGNGLWSRVSSKRLKQKDMFDKSFSIFSNGKTFVYAQKN